MIVACPVKFVGLPNWSWNVSVYATWLPANTPIVAGARTALAASAAVTFVVNPVAFTAPVVVTWIGYDPATVILM